jgi:hypothetical protein
LGACQGGKARLLSNPPENSPQFHARSDAGSDPITNIVGIDAGCVNASIRGQLRPTNLLFIIDRSGSMNCNLPEDGQSTADCDKFPIRRFADRPSKWDLTLDALRTALGALADTGRVRVAFSTFPVNGSACTVSEVPLQPFVNLDSERVPVIMAQLGELAPYGNTPLVGATILGYQYLLDEMRRNALPGESFVVLVSDGRETCRTDQTGKLLTVHAPTALEKLGVRTFVIGVPGSEDAREFLSGLAEAGGTVRSVDCSYGPTSTDGDCHFDMTTSTSFSSDLIRSLSEINAEVLSCSFSIPETTGGATVDLTRVNVSLNGQSIPFVASQSCNAQADGWQYTPGNASIRLCGTACAKAQRLGSDVSIVLGCPTAIW